MRIGDRTAPATACSTGEVTMSRMELVFLVALTLFIAGGGLAVMLWAGRNAGAECAARGGVFHCASGTTMTCDCYRKDGRVLLEDEGR